MHIILKTRNGRMNQGTYYTCFFFLRMSRWCQFLQSVKRIIIEWSILPLSHIWRAVKKSLPFFPPQFYHPSLCGMLKLCHTPYVTFLHGFYTPTFAWLQGTLFNIHDDTALPCAQIPSILESNIYLGIDISPVLMDEKEFLQDFSGSIVLLDGL